MEINLTHHTIVMEVNLAHHTIVMEVNLAHHRLACVRTPDLCCGSDIPVYIAYSIYEMRSIEPPPY